MALDGLFDLIRDEIPGAAAAVVGSVSGALHTRTYKGVDPASVEAPLREIVGAWHHLYAGLGGPVDFGSNDEVLISASRGYLLLKVHHDSGRFIGVFLSADGNIGYLRFRMREYLRRVLKRYAGHLGKTAAHAGLNRRTLYNKMLAHGLRREDFRT